LHQKLKIFWEKLDKTTVTFYDGQETSIIVSDPAMIDENNQYTDKVDFLLHENDPVKEIRYIGSLKTMDIIIEK